MLMKCAKSLTLGDGYGECAGLPIREEMRPAGRGKRVDTIGGIQLPRRDEGGVGTIDREDDDTVNVEDIAPPQTFTARLHNAMIEAGCPADGCEGIIDQVRAATETLEDDNPDLFIQACVNEVRKRFRRRR